MTPADVISNRDKLFRERENVGVLCIHTEMIREVLFFVYTL